MTVSELLSRIDSHELMEWAAYFEARSRSRLAPPAPSSIDASPEAISHLTKDFFGRLAAKRA